MKNQFEVVLGGSEPREEPRASFAGTTRPRLYARALSALSALVSALLVGCPARLDNGFALDDFMQTDREGPGPLVDAAMVSDGGSADAAPPRLDSAWLSNEAVVSLLQDRQYRRAGFRAVNSRAFPSALSPDKTIALFVSEAGYEAYTQISPERAGSKVALPVGTIIVREVLEGTTLDTITVMMRLPDGAFPLGGNWWYAAADAQGVIRADADDGTPVIGLLEDCGTCHLRRSNDDYLFGAPTGYWRRQRPRR